MLSMRNRRREPKRPVAIDNSSVNPTTAGRAPLARSAARMLVARTVRATRDGKCYANTSPATPPIAPRAGFNHELSNPTPALAPSALRTQAPCANRAGASRRLAHYASDDSYERMAGEHHQRGAVLSIIFVIVTTIWTNGLGCGSSPLSAPHRLCRPWLLESERRVSAIAYEDAAAAARSCSIVHPYGLRKRILIATV